MKSPEQMDKKPEQLKRDKEELEHKVTSPEEAAEMTRQRRKEYGLKEISELTPAEIKEIDATIEYLLEHLDGYDFNSFGPKIQDEWYWVEQEAKVGKDRELAKAVLGRFLSTLSNLKGNKENQID